MTNIFKYAPGVISGRSDQHRVKAVAHDIIPDMDKSHPFTNRIIAAGIVHCAFIMCDCRISQGKLSEVSKISTEMHYVSKVSIAKSYRYISDLYELDVW